MAKNRKVILEDDEQEIESSLEDYVLAKNNDALRSSLVSAAQNYSSAQGTKRVVTLRIYDNDILLLKEKALQQGIPYQTLITSVLHRYVSDDLIDKAEAKKIMAIGR